jgi:hypothetical protein
MPAHTSNRLRFFGIFRRAEAGAVAFRAAAVVAESSSCKLMSFIMRPALATIHLDHNRSFGFWLNCGGICIAGISIGPAEGSWPSLLHAG